MNIEQLNRINNYDIPAEIQSFDASLTEGMSKEQISSPEYQFKIIYTQDPNSKSRAAVRFISPESAEGKAINNVLIKYKPSDELYLCKAGKVVTLIKDRTEKKFTSYNHTQAWKKYKVRPINGSSESEKTHQEYCIYHKSHNDYTYSEKWVKYLEDIVNCDQKFNELKSFKQPYIYVLTKQLG